MAVYKCKMCGGTLNVPEDAKVVKCDYCGSQQTVYSFDEEKKSSLFERANNARFNCEFDKAAGLYEAIIAEFNKEAEAYWGLVLCKYGIEYVDDPLTQKKVPTCHRTQFSSIIDDDDYKKTVQYSDSIAKELYENEAKVIASLQKDILNISSKEDPFDVFICYKESDEKGGRTLDSVLAQDIYNELSEVGIKVFFARLTLENKLGSEYEPYIFAALHSAKIMIHVTTSSNHSEAIWVKNEWSRYLSLIAKGEKKVLIPCYKNMSPYDLPTELKNLQSQDMSKLGFMQDLVYGVKKILGLDKKVNNNPEISDSLKQMLYLQFLNTFETNLRFGYEKIEKQEYDAAQDLFESIIDTTSDDLPKGRAYIGLMIAKDKQSNIDSYLEAHEYNIENIEYLTLAKKFADDKCNRELEQIEAKVKEGLTKINKSKLISKYKECTEQVDNLDVTLKYEPSFITSLEGFFRDNESLNKSKEYIKKIYNYKKEKEKYIKNTVEKCLIELPSKVTLTSLRKLLQRIKENRKLLSSNPHDEILEVQKKNEIDAINFINKSSNDLVSNCEPTVEYYVFINDLKSVDNGEPFSEVLKITNEREKGISVARKKQKTKKAITAASIICGVLATLVAIFFISRTIITSSVSSLAGSCLENGNYLTAKFHYESLAAMGYDTSSEISVCNGLMSLKTSFDTQKTSQTRIIEGIRLIVQGGQKVDVHYEVENSTNINRSYYENSGNKNETIDTYEFSLYNPNRDGYSFLYWNTYSLSYKDNRTSLGLMSNWNRNSYKITYNLDGGTNDTSNPLKYSVEDSITLKNPTKTGHTFLGWYDSDGNRIETIEKGTFGDLVLNARWSVNTYVVTLNPNGGEVSPSSVEVTYKSNYSLPIPNRDGYTFNGWFYLNSKISNSGIWRYTTIETLYASWSIITYEITYNLDGGTNDSNNPSSYIVTDSFSLKEPTKTGYTFLGWYIENTNTKISQISGRTGDLTLNARWNDGNTYNVTLNPNGGEVSSTSVEVTYNSNYSLPIPNRDGYTFYAWYDGTDIVAKNGVWNFPSDKEFVASWTPVQYEINYIVGTGAKNGSNPYHYTIEDSIVLDAPTKAGFTFLGWYDGNNNKVTTIESGTIGDITLTASWVRNNYAVTLDPNGGELENNILEVEYGGSYSLETPKRLGYTFGGWYDGTNKINNSGTWYYTDIDTLTASWNIRTYYNQYDYDGGTATTSNPISFTVEDNILLNAPTKTGYTFLGWYDKNGNLVTSIGRETIENGVFEFTARWSINQYELTVFSEDDSRGTVKIVKGTGYYNENSTVTATPSNGCAFRGWYYNGTLLSRNATYSFSMPAYDYSLEGRFYSEEDVRLGTNPVITIDSYYPYFTYGLYPQTYVDDEDLISALNTITTSESNGWYLYNNNYYAKIVAKGTIEFNSGANVAKGTTCWFKCEPISWKTLSKKNNDYFVLSTKLLDVSPYYSSQSNRTIGGKTIYPNNYEHSDIRNWLNSTFYNLSFALGNSCVKTTTVDNSKSTTDTSKYVCNNTQDKVFLPSYQDYLNENYDFYSADDRICELTDWAIARGASSAYCTRSPTYDTDFGTDCYIFQVNWDGALFGAHANYNFGVRPAITINYLQ